MVVVEKSPIFPQEVPTAGGTGGVVIGAKTGPWGVATGKPSLSSSLVYR